MTVSNYMYVFHCVLHQFSSILIMLLQLLSLYASFVQFVPNPRDRRKGKRNWLARVWAS